MLKGASMKMGGQAKINAGAEKEPREGGKHSPKGNVNVGGSQGVASADLRAQHPHDHGDYSAKQHKGKTDHVRHQRLAGLKPGGGC